MVDTALLEIAGVAMRHAGNRSKLENSGDLPNVENLFSDDDIRSSHITISSWPGYSPTPMFSLSGLASRTGVADIFYKDEGGRFGLGSFKALGGAYAVFRRLNGEKDSSEVTVTSATDGNHGLSVAWGARRFGCRCVIFIHAGVSKGREAALQAQGAEVVRVEGNYDDSVRICQQAADDKGWCVVSDTTFDNSYRDIPTTVMAGYSVMAMEIVNQVGGQIPTHVFIQAGVGGLAAAVCETFRHAWKGAAPRLVIVEPDLAACHYASAEANTRSRVEIDKETVMAGLSCGEVSIIAWDVLKNHADDFVTIPDSVVAPTMRLLVEAPFGDSPIVAGESAVAGLAALIAASSQISLADSLKLNSDSRVLVIGTEGATDPAVYESMTGRSVAFADPAYAIRTMNSKGS